MTNCRCIAGLTSRWETLWISLGLCRQNNKCSKYFTVEKLLLFFSQFLREILGHGFVIHLLNIRILMYSK